MTKKILDVPFIKQKISYCGPAALAMVMQYYGCNINQDQIGDKIYAQYFGAKIGELEEIAKEEGFETISGSSSLRELISFIDDGCPVIVAQHETISDENVHYRVVVGYDSENKKIILHDPDLDEYLDISYWLFLSLWYSQGFDNVTLVLKKKFK